ncbi:hypothetical protein [Sphingomonas abaci]|uniref:Uncharacterized protein n=1 Tax=Sphingomonas abaci TaxID=237611 RepID=A0A7W7AN09_9SPHN|nr:hypothetical protein [Sphingomonas abaci]MBB4619990.1 hypothetical protein [Sphingomonas abaci]
MWIVIRQDTGEIVSGPVADEPTAGDNEEVVRAALGFPDRLTWSPDLRGFVDVERPRYTFNAWVDLFPLEEQVAIVTATMADPMAKLIYDRAQSASGSIDPADPRTLEGLGYLVGKGWVSQATYDRIAAL